MKFAIIDVETTGTSAKTGKIIEIAIILHDGEKVEERFSTLIDPERSLPPYITHLTGINQEMLADAPPFYQVAKKIIELTQDRIFVAHNVSFDYEFIRKEFEDLGYSFLRKKLCTVRMTRRLFPGLGSYALKNLCTHFNLSNLRPHRALEDALVTTDLFDILLKESTRQGFESLVDLESKGYTLPPKIDRDQVDTLPETTGVYLMKDEAGNFLYIGKSKNIRKRVVDHLSDRSSNKKDYSFKVMLTEIDAIETGSEVIALLLENQLIKRHRPSFNYARRRTKFKWGLFSKRNEDEITLSVREIQEGDEYLLSFSSKKAAIQKYEELGIWIESGLDLNDHPSLAFPMERRVFLDKGRTRKETSFVLIDHGRVQGFGYAQNLDLSMFIDGVSSELEYFELDDYPDMKTLLLPFIHDLKSFQVPDQSSSNSILN